MVQSISSRVEGVKAVGKVSLKEPELRALLGGLLDPGGVGSPREGVVTHGWGVVSWKTLLGGPLDPEWSGSSTRKGIVTHG